MTATFTLKYIFFSLIISDVNWEQTIELSRDRLEQEQEERNSLLDNREVNKEKDETNWTRHFSSNERFISCHFDNNNRFGEVLVTI